MSEPIVQTTELFKFYGTDAGRFVYKVTRTEIVKPDAVWIVDQTPTATATLFACHPPGSPPERILVFADLAPAA